MIPTCELLAKDCDPLNSFNSCSKCGAPISWHEGGSLDVYVGRNPKKMRREVHRAFFG